MLHIGEKLNREQFMEEVACAHRAALLLDYDGTLAPFQVNRQHALPYQGVGALVSEIMKEGRTRVVLVTGRPAAEVIPLLGILPHPEVWGAQGLQRLRADGSYEMVRLDEHALEGLGEADLWLRDQGLHHLTEFKPGSLAVHWRGLRREAAANLRGQVLLGWLPIVERHRLALLEFDGGLEIRSPVRNKGDAVRAILAEMDERAPVAYLGDDATDEDAFRTLQNRGLTLLVRPEWRETCAQLWLRPPGELLDFLSQWLRACRAMSGSPREATA